jgi:hypothetical protein
MGSAGVGEVHIGDEKEVQVVGSGKYISIGK